MGLAQWGWDEYFAAAFKACGADGEPGRVISDGRGFCRITAGGSEFLVPMPAGQPLVAGDWIVFDRVSRTVRALLPRRTKISRKKAGAEYAEQILAANVDVLFVVMGLDGDFNLRRLERYLITARASGAAPVIVLNKSDLCEDTVAVLQRVDEAARGADPLVLMSARERGSAMQLHRYVEPGQTAVVVGSSGVGKSTIVNALLRSGSQIVTEVRAGDSRGRHTTTARHLFRLEEGWMLIDTPGLRELQPWAPSEAVAGVFSEIDSLAAECRFRDCSHTAEPGCAVQAAVEAGKLDARRLESFHKLGAELRYAERMQDPLAMLEHKRKWKQIHRAARSKERWTG